MRTSTTCCWTGLGGTTTYVFVGGGLALFAHVALLRRLLEMQLLRGAFDLLGLRPPPPFTSSQTLFGHAVYLAAVALSLFLLPGIARSLLALPAEADWWSRLLAVPLFNLGVLCIGVARTHSRPLIKLTVVMRLWVMITLAILVAARLAPVVALTAGVIDLLSAALTAWALAAETRSPP